MPILGDNTMNLRTSIIEEVREQQQPVLEAAAVAQTLNTRMDTVEDAAAPLTSGFADQKQLVPDGSSLGWFDGPVMVANWAPYKADGDDATPVASRLQSFISDAAATKIPGVILPGQYHAEDIVSVPSNTTLYLHGATLQDHNPSLGSGTTSDHQPMLRLENAQNVVIEGGTFNGRKDFHTGVSEFKYGIGIYGGSNITLRDLVFEDCKGDGLFFGRWPYMGAPYTPPENVTVERVISRRSHRNGASVTAGRHIHFIDCLFEDSQGTAPQAGVDIEPNNTAEEVRDISFTRCVFRGNAAAGVLTHPGSTAAGWDEPRTDILYDGCTFMENGGEGVRMSGINRQTLRDCTIVSNGARGLVVELIGADLRGLTVRGGSIRDNWSDGIGILGGAGREVTDILLDGVEIVRNNRAGAASPAGVNLGQGVTNAIQRVTLRSCQLGDPEVADPQYAGLRIGGDHVSSVILTDNRFGNYSNRRMSGYTAGRVVSLSGNVGIVGRNGGVTSIASGGNINHGLGDGVGGWTPRFYTVAATASNRHIAVTSVNSVSLVVSITDSAGSSVTTPENVSWWAEA